MLVRFADGQAPTLDALRAAVATGDAAEAERHAHGMARAAGKLGVVALRGAPHFVSDAGREPESGILGDGASHRAGRRLAGRRNVEICRRTTSLSSLAGAVEHRRRILVGMGALVTLVSMATSTADAQNREDRSRDALVRLPVVDGSDIHFLRFAVDDAPRSRITGITQDDYG
jgi:hypothetical protein